MLRDYLANTSRRELEESTAHIHQAKTTWNSIGQNVLAARQLQIATVDRK